MRLFVCGFLASCAPLGAVDLRVPVEGAVATTEWDVARVEVSDLRLHWPSTAGLELIPSAWAHPGHGSAGDVGAELLGAWTLEPDARELGEAVAWAGRYTSASFSVGEVVLSRGTEELRVRVDEPVQGVPVAVSLKDGSALALTWHADGALSSVSPGETDGLAVERAVRFSTLSTLSWSVEAL